MQSNIPKQKRKQVLILTKHQTPDQFELQNQVKSGSSLKVRGRGRLQHTLGKGKAVGWLLLLQGVPRHWTPGPL